MAASDIFRIIVEGAFYDIVKYLVAPLAVTAAIGVILRVVFGKLQAAKEIIIFSVCAFCAVAMVFWVVGARSQQPNLVGGIQSVMTGSPDGRNSFSVLTMAILNTGNMQSIVKNESVEATIGGVKYQGRFIPQPKDFTYTAPHISPSSPTALIYHGEDDLLSKAIYPIQAGSIMMGTLYVMFDNVSPEAFKAGADFAVTYEDIFSKSYVATIKSTAQMVDIGTIPGLHTDLICKPLDGKLPPPTTSN